MVCNQSHVVVVVVVVVIDASVHGFPKTQVQDFRSSTSEISLSKLPRKMCENFSVNMAMFTTFICP